MLGYWPTNASVRREQDEVFCAPEQRDEKAPTARGDIFSVGAILAYCLVGEAPGAGLLPSSGRSDVDDVCRAALAREPELRFANAQAMLHAIEHIGWGSEPAQVARGRYYSGHPGESHELRLLPARNEMLSARPVTIWVLDGDPSFDSPVMTEALAELSVSFEVRRLGEADRELALEELSSGRITPPWVVLFGGIHVLVEEPLLKVLATSAEVSRLLLLGGDSYELLQRSVNDVGLEQYLCAPEHVGEVLHSVQRLVARTRRLTLHYDAVRRELRRSRDELSRRSRELTAVDGAAASY